MEISHIQKYIHTTPRKLRLVAHMVRKMKPEEALNILRFTPKSAAKELEKAIKGAMSNAKVSKLNDIDFKSIEINEGPKMRRFHAGTRGRAKPFRRKMAHIKIVLTDNSKIKNEKIIQNNSEELSKSEGQNPARLDQKVEKSDKPAIRNSDLSGTQSHSEKETQKNRREKK